MAGGVMDGVDDGLAIGANLVHTVVEVEYPAQRLLWRRDVVALRTEDDDRRAYVAQVEGGAVGCLDVPCREIVADEQLVDDELYFLGIQLDVAAPPAFESEIARFFGIYLRIEIVLLAPQRIRGIQIFEILDEPRAVEFSVT